MTTHKDLKEILGMLGTVLRKSDARKREAEDRVNAVIAELEQLLDEGIDNADLGVHPDTRHEVD